MVFKLVEEFNVEVVKIDRDTHQLLEPKEFDWLVGALKEEVTELEDAKDMTEQVDALIDMIYFAAGGLTRMGIGHETALEIFTLVHDSNMTKAAGKKKGREIQIDLDASKPDDFVPPDEAIRRILQAG